MKNRHLKPKNWNEHVVKYLIIALGLALFVTAILTACTKKSSFTYKPLEQIGCDFGIPQSEYVANAKKKGRGKPQPPVDTVSVDPVYSGNVLYLDFDGEVVSGTSWNVWGDMTLSASGLDQAGIDSVVRGVRAEYGPMGFTVTTDRRVYEAGIAGHRQMVVFTESWEWYGRAGGAAYVGSYSQVDANPCFVFTSLLGYNEKWVKDAGVHELGHSLKLRHVPGEDGSTYCNCPNYMGNSYNWPNPEFSRRVVDQFGNTVDQINTIASNL